MERGSGAEGVALIFSASRAAPLPRFFMRVGSLLSAPLWGLVKCEKPIVNFFLSPSKIKSEREERKKCAPFFLIEVAKIKIKLTKKNIRNKRFMVFNFFFIFLELKGND